MSIAIVMTMYKRFEYTSTVLKSVVKNAQDIGDIPFLMFVDRGCDDVADLALRFAKNSGLRAEVFLARERLGCNQNTFRAIDTAMDSHDAVIAIEDDVVLGRDAIRYFKWGLGEYADDPSIFSISGYHRDNAITDDVSGVARRRCWFVPWGWATWRDRWERARGPVDPGVSWDTWLSEHVRKGRYEVYPPLSRTQNIGAHGGQHVPSAEWHAENQWNPVWVDAFPDHKITQWCEEKCTAT
jgi:hypothetical protein